MSQTQFSTLSLYVVGIEDLLFNSGVFKKLHNRVQFCLALLFGQSTPSFSVCPHAGERCGVFDPCGNATDSTLPTPPGAPRSVDFDMRGSCFPNPS